MQTHRSFYSDRKKVFSEPGTRTKPKYSARYDDDGVLVLDEVGVIDTYEDIQSYHDSVDMTNILRRFYSGETDVIQKVQGFYADVSDLPKSNVEFLNRVLESQEFFMSLPPEVREVYGNDFARFIADFDTSSLYRSFVPADSLDALVPVADPEPEPEPIKKTTKKTTKKVDDDGQE